MKDQTILTLTVNGKRIRITLFVDLPNSMAKSSYSSAEF
jgi:hypothetical protein